MSAICRLVNQLVAIVAICHADGDRHRSGWRRRVQDAIINDKAFKMQYAKRLAY